MCVKRQSRRRGYFRYIKPERWALGSGSYPRLIPINTLSFVRLRAGSVGGTTVRGEIRFSRVGTLGVIGSLGIAPVVAFTEAVADNLD